MTDVGVETPLDRLTTYITPNDAFFVRHHWPATAPDPRDWALVVDGKVSRPLRLSLAELKDLPSTSVTCVLECSGNGRSFFRPPAPGLAWGPGAVGNARWEGVRVSDLLAKAGRKDGAKQLHAAGTDDPPRGQPPFHRSVALEKALKDAVVAWEMNGEPLPSLHGGPARLIVPGWAGNNWMKWLAKLSLRSEPAKGFFMDEDYCYPTPAGMRPITELPVKSILTAAPSRARLGSPVTVRGVAYSGAPDVSKVEVTDDGGRSWHAAELGREHDPYAWRLWSFQYDSRRAGKVTLHARATDSRGSVQPRETAWNPGGYLYNGWHAAEIEVR
ncbi:MAG TPA: sulfite oxidase [Thermoanaerobaculia bacterium]